MDAVTKAIEDSKKYAGRHENQDKYDELLKGEYIFTCKKVEEYVDKKNGVILDMGTAYGTVPAALKILGYDKVYAQDLTKSYLNKGLIDQYKIPFKTCNIEREVPKMPEKADFIIFTEILEHLNNNAQTAIENLAAVTKKGGLLLITTPEASEQGYCRGMNQKYIWWDEVPKTHLEWKDEHTRHWHQLEITDVVHRAGFTVIEAGLCYDNRSTFVVARYGA